MLRFIFMNPILEWVLTVIGGGGIGAIITYIATFKSRKMISESEAKLAETSAEQAKLDLNQDKYDYLQSTCDKYIKDYHELETDFRKQMRDLRESIDTIMHENTKAISDKCNEIARLKSQVTYLKGIRCYNFTCTHRIKNDPDKEAK